MGKYLPAIITGVVVTIILSVLLGVIGMQGLALFFIPVFLGLVTGYIMANLQGTKAGPTATGEQKAAALRCQPSPGKALLVVYRQGFVGMAAGINVSLDGRLVAQIKSPQFTAVEVDPGSHLLEITFVGLAAAQNQAFSETINLSAGEVAAFRATLSMGAVKNTIRMERIDEMSGLSDLPRTLAGMKMVAPA